jgi:hypothetical protein
MADRARLRTSRPHVLADPSQVGEHGVWTRATDILPGLTIANGDPVVAAWGAQIWHAHARWDDDDRGTLWLQPISGTADPLAVDTESVLGHLRAALTDALAADGDRRGSPIDIDQTLTDLEDVVRPVLEEVNEAFEVILQAFEQRRQDAVWIFDAVSRRGARAMDPASPALMVLARLAHRARPTMGEGSTPD